MATPTPTEGGSGGRRKELYRQTLTGLTSIKKRRNRGHRHPIPPVATTLRDDGSGPWLLKKASMLKLKRRDRLGYSNRASRLDLWNSALWASRNRSISSTSIEKMAPPISRISDRKFNSLSSGTRS